MSHLKKTNVLTLASVIMLAGCSTPEPQATAKDKVGLSALDWQYANWRKSVMLPPQIQAMPLGLDRQTGDSEAKQLSVLPVALPGSASAMPNAAAAPADQSAKPAVSNSPAFAQDTAAPADAAVPIAASPQNGISVPPNQCWAQVVIPPRRTESKKVLTLREEATRHEITQPVLEQGVQQVVVKDAASVYKVEPPRFKPVAERVLVSEAVPKLVIEPAVYETQHESVEVESSQITMRDCRGAGPAASKSAFQRNSVLCATEVPPRYKNVSRQVLVKPETVREEVTPAVYKTVTRMVLDQPAKVTEVPLPEVRKTMPLQTLQRPGQAQAQTVPAQTTSVQVIQHEGLPFLTWRRTLCERDMSRDLISQLQEALSSAGMDIGKADGKMGKRTWVALQNYQQQEGLASGHLTYETLERLQLKAP